MTASGTVTEDDILVLTDGSVEECSAVMNKFIINNEKKAKFEELSFEIKKSLYVGIFSRISQPTTTPALVNILLNSLRILSRELSTLDLALTEDHIQTLLKVSKLKPSDEFANCSDSETLEALKVIFNITFQSALLRSKFVSNGLLECLVESVEAIPEKSFDIKYFRMRILFIMTALSRDCVTKVRKELQGLHVLIDDLQPIDLETEFDDQKVELISEILKVVYNIMYNQFANETNRTTTTTSEEEDLERTEQKKVIDLVKHMLLRYVKSENKKNDIQSHSIDLLAVIPQEMLGDLIENREGTEFTYEGHDVAAIESLVTFLDTRLDVKPSPKNGSLTELLSPILSVLVRIASQDRIARRYLKSRVLPPLKKADVLQRPEVGTSLRNKLCVLMTSPASPVTHLVSNFLFILVKENVQRLIKYTGFGNAAGLLANRGLFGGGKSPGAGAYSSESEDSDTEEYKKVSHLVNGFGWIEPEHPPPCAGMTEEQKEVEAMKLVNAIDKLNRAQLIQPVQIGRDGRLQPIEHVRQLLESSSESLVRSNQRRESDSSDST